MKTTLIQNEKGIVIGYRQTSDASVRTYDLENRLHSFNDEPAFADDDCMVWHNHSVIHRKKGPAEINYFEKNVLTICWIKSGCLHRSNNRPAKVRY
jgi:hypothetical protein